MAVHYTPAGEQASDNAHVSRSLPLALALVLWGAVRAEQQPSFRSGTLGVRVDVLVTDGRKPVTGLKSDDFEIRDNGVLQTIDLVDTADVALNVVLALDTSGSTEGQRHDDLVAASQLLLDGLKPGDRAALTTFTHAVMPVAGLTSDVGSLRADLQNFSPSGRTSVMDGVYVALTETLAQPGRSLLVVCTDGMDISSWLEPRDVLDTAKRSNAVIYAVTSSDARRTSSLEDLTETTGGDMLRFKSRDELRGAFQAILQEFRSRYILAYIPDGVPHGGVHRLDVRVKRRGLTVKARPGYVGAEPVR
jgi:VWFA-related protein